MTFTELTRDQLIQLKIHYMTELVNAGEFAEVMNVDYDEPSYGDLADADDLIPDDVIFEHYGDMEFSEDDFCL